MAFGGMGGFGNMQQMMKQAEALKRQMDKAKEDLKEETVSATSGGGMVEVVMTGEKKIVSIKFNPAVVDPDDVETLEDLVVSAFNQAEEKAEALRESKLGAFGGMM